MKKTYDHLMKEVRHFSKENVALEAKLNEALKIMQENAHDAERSKQELEESQFNNAAQAACVKMCTATEADKVRYDSMTRSEFMRMLAIFRHGAKWYRDKNE
jgi:hypothetical protein